MSEQDKNNFNWLRKSIVNSHSEIPWLEVHSTTEKNLFNEYERLIKHEPAENLHLKNNDFLYNNRNRAMDEIKSAQKDSLFLYQNEIHYPSEESFSLKEKKEQPKEANLIIDKVEYFPNDQAQNTASNISHNNGQHNTQINNEIKSGFQNGFQNNLKDEKTPSLIPEPEKFLLTQFTAQSFQPGDTPLSPDAGEDQIFNFYERPEFTQEQQTKTEPPEETDEADKSEDNSEFENLLQSPVAQAPVKAPPPMQSEGKTIFRSSATPEVVSNEQYRIPFNVLHTSVESNNFTDPVEVQQIIEKLEQTLEQFGIEARVVGMQKGPIITRYELRIPPGIKVNRILSLTEELAMALEAFSVRIEAPIPGRSTVGIEIPNKKRSMVLLGDIINHPEYNSNSLRLPLPLGKDIAGNLLLEDLTRMPHILIAGATGAGKSVAINAFITNLIISKSPEEVRMLMIDPKLVELSQYNDIPHLLHPVIADPQKAVLGLNWAVEEMERRYEDMADMRARDIVSYNVKVEQYNKNRRPSEEYIPKMPYIIVLIDELGDLMMVAGKEVESSIIRLSQKARAVGIHLILATQRPSVDVITALIKANCPARIALQVAQKTDSRTILDSNGGEQLLGQGDMLFKHPSKAQLIRAQSPFVSDEEVENVVQAIKQLGKPSYIVLDDPKTKANELEVEDEELFDEAWNIIQESQKASASYLQRRLRIGYNRAARLIEAFEARGYIGPQVGSKPREILIQ